MKPKTLVDLEIQLRKLPGISKKISERLAYNLIQDDVNTAELLTVIKSAVENIETCDICFGLSDTTTCDICADTKRKKVLVVVETPLDVFRFEDILESNYYYHVLGSLVDIKREGEELDTINYQSLKMRAKNFNEVILALSPNLEGIVTSNLIRNTVDAKKITQLATGIPIGAATEYVDGLTLKLAIKNRKEVD